MMDNNLTSNELNKDAKQLANTSKGVVNGAKKAVNTANKAVKTAKNVSEKATKKIAKDSAKAGKGVVKAILSNPYVLFGVTILLFLLMVFISYFSHEGSMGKNYREASYKVDNPEDGKAYCVTKEQKELAFALNEAYENGNAPDFIDVSLDINGDIYDKSISLDAYEHEPIYDGESSEGQCYVSFNWRFHKAFKHIYEVLCKDEILRCIEDRDYHYQRTMETYNACENPFLDVNYAEAITMVGLSEDYSLRNGSLSSIYALLENDKKMENLYSIFIHERKDEEILCIEEETIEREISESSDTLNENTIVSQYDFRQVRSPKNGISSYNELLEYARSHEGTLEKPDAPDGYYVRNRCVIFPPEDYPDLYWRFRTYVKDQHTETRYDHAKEMHEYSYVNPKTHKTEKGKVEITVLEEHEYIVTTIEKTVSREFFYGDCRLYRYGILDFLEMIDVDAYENNVDYPTITNLEMVKSIDTSSALQAEYVRYFCEDVDFGNPEESPLRSPYYYYMKLSKNMVELLDLIGFGYVDFDELLEYGSFQDYGALLEEIIECYGTRYSQGARMGGKGSSMDCASFVCYVYDKIGIHLGDDDYGYQSDGKSHGNALTCSRMNNWFLSSHPEAVVSDNTLQAGDILFLHTPYEDWEKAQKKYPNYDKNTLSDHVVIYLGNGKIADCSPQNTSLYKDGGVAVRDLPKTYANSVISIARPSQIDSIKE